MPRVNRVNKARKSQGRCGNCPTLIKVGDPYVWYKFRFGGKYVRCAKTACYPKASDLTRSEFYSQLYGIQDAVSNAMANHDVDSLRSAADDLRTLGEECSEKRSNMPDQLQDSDTGSLLEERASECEDKASELESAADELEDLINPDDWETYARENGIERKKGGESGESESSENEESESDDEFTETEEEFEARVREAIEEENNDEWNNREVDLNIS